MEQGELETGGNKFQFSQFMPPIKYRALWETEFVELSEAQLQSFIVLYETEFGVKLSLVEAQEHATSLLFFISLCIKPLAKNTASDINNKPE